MCFQRFSGLRATHPASVSCPEAKAQPSYSQAKPDRGHCQLADLMSLSDLVAMSYSRVEAAGSLVPESSIDNSMPALDYSYASEAPAESPVV